MADGAGAGPGGGGGGGGERDPLLDFFDLSKKFEKVTLVGAQAAGRFKYNESAREPPPMHVHDSDDEDDDNYHLAVKERERKAMQSLVRAAESANKSRGAGAAIGDSGGSGTVRRRAREGTHMSGLEKNTVVGSSFPDVGRRVSAPNPEDSRLLGDNFDFSKTPRVGTAVQHVHEEREKIVEVIQNNRVSIITGQTGCGKTTQIPMFILDHYRHKPSGDINIIVTQPRRIAAISVARRASQERGWQVGSPVGYKVGMDRDHHGPSTKLLYCTTGVLKKMIIGRKTLAEWTHIFLDEVHEREEDMDFLLLLCKKLLLTSRGTKLILMSATIDVDPFVEYYTFPIHEAGEEEAGVHEITEKVIHKVDIFYSDEDDLGKYYRQIGASSLRPDPNEGPKLHDQNIDLCRTIIDKLDKMEEREGRAVKGTVLVFLPGENEILRVKRYLLEDEAEAEQKGWDTLILHSRIPTEDTQLVFNPPGPGRRKIILATNMAESSITIPDVEYVVDFCLTKILMADPETNYVSLQLQWADKNSCEQRKGRAGRVQSGRAFRLVPKAFYDYNLPVEHDPEMLRAPLDKVILDTKLLDFHDFGTPKELLALAMTPPRLENIQKTVMHLKQIGALLPTVNGVQNKDDGDITLLGEIVAGLPVDCKLGKLIIFGHLFGVLEEAIIIAAGLANKSIFTTPMEKKLQAYASKLVWADRSFSDCLAVLIAFQSYEKRKRQGLFERAVGSRSRRTLEQEWCYSRYLQVKALRDMQVTIEELKLNLKRYNIQDFPAPNRAQLPWIEKCRFLQYAIFGAFYPNYFVRHFSSHDLRDVHRTLNGHDPMTSVYLTNFPNAQADFAQLYVDDIKAKFRVCSEPEHTFIHFDGGKVVVQFARSSHKPEPGSDSANPGVVAVGDNLTRLNEEANLTGEIVHQVYVAMKMRSLPRETLNLALYKEDHAKRFLEEAREEEERSREAVERGGRTRDGGQVNTQLKFSAIGRIDPPGLSITSLVVDVVHVNNPSSFWIQYKDSESREMFARLERTIQCAVDIANKAKGKKRVSNASHPKTGCVYLAPYNDGEQLDYYRARLDGIHIETRSGQGRYGHDLEGLKVRVHYIDFGNSGIVSATELIMIDSQLKQSCPELWKTPAVALECALVGIKPNPIRNPKGIWDKSVIEYFRRLVLDRTVRAEIYSVVSQADSPLLNLVIEVDGKNINRDLMEDVLEHDNEDPSETSFLGDHEVSFTADGQKKCPPRAVKAAESYLSEENHKDRLRCDSFNPHMKAQIEKHQRTLNESACVSLVPHLVSGSEDLKRVQVTLRGPHHPLQFNLVGAHRIGSNKDIRVEQDSVNSVLLERFPQDDHDQWLVAAHVGMNAGGNALMLRHTTFLPNHHGLGAMLTMIFAPTVEMRTDLRRKSYTGCLAGLGYRDKDWGKAARTGHKTASQSNQRVSYYGEHDMEIKFDVDIDNDDLCLINKVRYYINDALTRDLRNLTKGDGTPLPLDVQRREGHVKLENARELHQLQDNIRRSLGQLLGKNRMTVDRQVFKREYGWLEWPDSKYHKTTKIENSDKHIFQMITGYVLKNEQSRYNETHRILVAAAKFHEFAQKSPYEQFDAVCPVCPGSQRFTTGIEVAKHIMTPQHYDRIDEV